MAGKKSSAKSAVPDNVQTKTVENTKPAKSSAENKVKKSEKTDGKKKQNKVVKYFKDLKSEFKKVVWPSRKTVINNTGVVLVVMIICGVAIWGLDSAFAALLMELLSLAGGQA